MRWIFGDFVEGRGAIGLLIVRLVFGLGLMMHGWQKIESPGGPAGWMGPNSPVPSLFQALSTLAEFGGGLALILGLLTPLAALGIACNMVVALGMVHLPHGDPFVAAPGGSSFESAAGYLAVALLVLITGPGAVSLDRVLARGLRWRPRARLRSGLS